MEAASPLQASCSRVIGCSSMGTRELRHKVLQFERLLRYTNITILITIITIAIIVIMTILLLLLCGYYYSWQVQTLQLFRGRRRLLQLQARLLTPGANYPQPLYASAYQPLICKSPSTSSRAHTSLHIAGGYRNKSYMTPTYYIPFVPCLSPEGIGQDFWRLLPIFLYPGLSPLPAST